MLSLEEEEIRPVRPDELEQVSLLEELCFNDPYPSYFLEQLAQDNPETFLVAVVQEKIVGYAVVDPWKDDNHLISIAVHPEARKKGIGTQLMLALEARVRNRKPMRLEVRRNNTPAIQFYHGHGFREIGVAEGYYADGEDAILMEKPKKD